MKQSAPTGCWSVWPCLAWSCGSSVGRSFSLRTVPFSRWGWSGLCRGSCGSCLAPAWPCWPWGGCLRFLRKPGATGKRVLVCAAVICVLLAFSVACLRSLVLDLPYLHQPAVARLDQLHFEQDVVNDGGSRYSLEGVTPDGTVLSFPVSRRVFHSGLDAVGSGRELQAEITYLPHTDVLLSLDYLTPEGSSSR